ncbi:MULTISPECIES: mechanosensitive ion channel domain-containing protein [unclassified Caballeronia]|uniref:mechanosensitive ion channel family protein n=1 Tax=unclassified Caballeronia TaxID=2646786 RepID=UPI0028573C54|nr:MULTISPECIES: mechanosensitive ion channel domain-containing protein [unclassified Caballeronia]MDR5750658.1 mechanosensitive ion channel [Caballeronia sp. LZ024]MDR5842309.1 mechanosensitive ion channel [Caballeronia sp. LZ031]
MISFDDFIRIAEAPLHTWPGALGVAALGVAFAIGVHRVGARILVRIARPYPLMSVVLRYIDTPALVLLIILALGFVLFEAPDTLPFAAVLRDLATVALIVALTFLAARSASAVGEAIVQAHPLDTENNLHARRIHTQARVLARSVMVVIVIIGFGGALMTFPSVRQIGASLLASAGVAGLVAGIAARPVLGNLIAGLQIALSQPIRLDDVVVIQGEWGRVEEITGTYVSIRIWDQRRLIVPLQWFIENPFTNWTRNSSQIIGTVFFYVDYRMPILPLREELERILEHAPEWDGRVQVLQVTDATERSMQLRVLVSSFDSGLNWDLRCRVREGLLNFVQAAYPQFLPRTRADLSSDKEHLAHTEFAPPLERTGPAPKAASTANTAADPVASRGERSGPDRAAHAMASTTPQSSAETGTRR